MEIIGLVAIVATLVFLALEVRQNTTALTAAAWQGRSDALQNLSMSVAESELLSRISAHVSMRDQSCDAREVFCSDIDRDYILSLSPEEYESYRRYLMAHAFRIQNLKVQYESGLLTDEYYARGVIGAIRNFMPLWEAFQVPQGVRLSEDVERFDKSN